MSQERSHSCRHVSCSVAAGCCVVAGCYFAFGRCSITVIAGWSSCASATPPVACTPRTKHCPVHTACSQAHGRSVLTLNNPPVFAPFRDCAERNELSTRTHEDLRLLEARFVIRASWVMKQNNETFVLMKRKVHIIPRGPCHIVLQYVYSAIIHSSKVLASVSITELRLAGQRSRQTLQQAKSIQASSVFATASCHCQIAE